MGKRGFEKRAEHLALLLEITRGINSGLEVKEIIVTLKEGAGSQWDPRVIEAALRMLCRKGNI